MNDQLSPLFRKVLEAHHSDDAPHFTLPGKACLLTIQKNGSDQPFELLAQSIPGARYISTFSSSELALFDEVSAPKGAFRLALDQLPEQLRQALGDDCYSVYTIPLSLISSAKGYLLLPDKEGSLELHFEKYFSFLGDMVGDCLFENLITRYTPQKLFSFPNPRAIAEDFSEAVAEWLCPISYNCNGVNVNYFAPDRKQTTEIKLELSDDEGNRMEMAFTLSSHGYPLPAFPDNVHEIDFVEMRRLYIKSRLKSFFIHLVQFWRHNRDNSFPLQLDQAIAYVASALDLAKKYKGQLKSSLEKLEEIREKSKLTPSTPVPPFAFYLSSSGQWKVFFDSNDCSMKSNSPQGMASIQYLLSSPNERIDATALYQVVKDQGYTYNTASSDATIDPELDQVNLSEVKESYRQNLPYWDQIKHQSMAEMEREDLDLLQFLIAQLDIIIKYERNRTDLIGLRKRIKEKIDLLIMKFDIDPNFANPYSAILKLQEPSGNVKNRTDSLRSNIRRAISNFQEMAPDLYKYLDHTIILTKSQSSDPEHLPFMFVPHLVPSEQHRSIIWDTRGDRQGEDGTI